MTMMVRFFCIALFAITLIACSGVQVSQEYIPDYYYSSLKTFIWKPKGNQAYGIADNELVDKGIRRAIENTLLAKSYSKVDTYTPDFFVSYFVTVEQKANDSGVSDGNSSGGSGQGGYGGVGFSADGKPRDYKKGTLLIDVTIPIGNQIIWRGISTQPLAEHISPDEATAIIDETVEKVLQQFPPNKK
jgi:hypothetical protein